MNVQQVPGRELTRKPARGRGRCGALAIWRTEVPAERPSSATVRRGIKHGNTDLDAAPPPAATTQRHSSSPSRNSRLVRPARQSGSAMAEYPPPKP